VVFKKLSPVLILDQEALDTGRLLLYALRTMAV